MKTALVGTALVVLLSGCSIKPIVDLKMVKDPVKYQDDLIQCHVLSQMGVSEENRLGQNMARTTGLSLALGTNPLPGYGGDLFADMMLTPVIRAQMTAKCLHGRGYLVVNRRAMGLLPWQRCMAEDGEWYLFTSDECEERYRQEDRKWSDYWGLNLPE